MESERIPPLVFKHRECEAPACLVADVKRCRRRALEYNPYPIPVFSPFDRIQRRTVQELGDLCYIDRKATNPIWQLGYTGPGWYHRAMGEHLLHYGQITWENVTHTFTATGHLPAGIFAKPQ